MMYPETKEGLWGFSSHPRRCEHHPRYPQDDPRYHPGGWFSTWDTWCVDRLVDGGELDGMTGWSSGGFKCDLTG